MTTPTPVPDWNDSERGDGLVAIVDDEDPGECTVFPYDADDVDLLSTWMTAHGDAFVSLDSMR